MTVAIPLSIILLGASACFGGKKQEEEVPMPVLKDDRPWITLSGIEPTEGEPGTEVVLKGTNFQAPRDPRRLITVHFGRKLVKIIHVAHDGELVVEVPKGKRGEVVDVQATFDPGGTAKLTKAFTYR